VVVDVGVTIAVAIVDCVGDELAGGSGAVTSDLAAVVIGAGVNVGLLAFALSAGAEPNEKTIPATIRKLFWLPNPTIPPG
jgi:hypothetical protein